MHVKWLFLYFDLLDIAIVICRCRHCLLPFLLHSLFFCCFISSPSSHHSTELIFAIFLCLHQRLSFRLPSTTKRERKKMWGFLCFVLHRNNTKQTIRCDANTEIRQIAWIIDRIVLFLLPFSFNFRRISSLLFLLFLHMLRLLLLLLRLLMFLLFFALLFCSVSSNILSFCFHSAMPQFICVIMLLRSFRSNWNAWIVSVPFADFECVNNKCMN